MSDADNFPGASDGNTTNIQARSSTHNPNSDQVSFERRRTPAIVSLTSAGPSAPFLPEFASNLHAEITTNVSDCLQAVRGTIGSFTSSLFALQHQFSEESVWVLGRCYANSCLALPLDRNGGCPPLTEQQREEQEMLRLGRIYSDLSSRIWVSYRAGFPPIGPSGLTSDAGWGCMIRSGQMMLAHALMTHFLSRDFRLSPECPPPAYSQIIRWFGDYPARACPFSLHEIVSQGYRRIGKPPGQWFSPGEICQMLRICMQNSGLDSVTVVVADNTTLSKEQILRTCTAVQGADQTAAFLESSSSNQPSSPSSSASSSSSTSASHPIHAVSASSRLSAPSSSSSAVPASLLSGGRPTSPALSTASTDSFHSCMSLPNGSVSSASSSASTASSSSSSPASSHSSSSTSSSVLPPPGPSHSENALFSRPGASVASSLPATSFSSSSSSSTSPWRTNYWRAAIVFIPLRLGLGTHIDRKYVAPLLACLSMPHSIGFIGGRPQSSLYFIGRQGDRLLYMDPHTVQRVASLDTPLTQAELSSYSCPDVLSMNAYDVDPSLALGFYCRSKADFLEWWECARKLTSQPGQAIFGMVDDQSASSISDEKSADICANQGGRGETAEHGLAHEQQCACLSEDEEDDDFVLV